MRQKPRCDIDLDPHILYNIAIRLRNAHSTSIGVTTLFYNMEKSGVHHCAGEHTDHRRLELTRQPIDTSQAHIGRSCTHPSLQNKRNGAGVVRR